MSRVKLCDAWQIAFNRLIYYASFLEEKSVALDAADVKIFKEEFTVVSASPEHHCKVSTETSSGMIYSVSSSSLLYAAD